MNWSSMDQTWSKHLAKFNGTSIYSSGGKWSEHIDPDRRINEWMDGKYKHPEVDDCSCWVGCKHRDGPFAAIVRCGCSSHKPSHQPASSSQPDAAWRIRCTRCGQAHHRACEIGAWHRRPGPQHCRDEKAISEAFLTRTLAGLNNTPLCRSLPPGSVLRPAVASALDALLKRYAQSIEGAMNVSAEYWTFNDIDIPNLVFFCWNCHLLFTTGWL